MRIRQYVPVFTEPNRESLEVFEFNGQDELRQVPFVKRWITWPFFDRFYVNNTLLMVRMKNDEHYVVGVLSDGEHDPAN